MFRDFYNFFSLSLFSLVSIVFLFPNDVSAQCTFISQGSESPPCYESAPYPTSCTAVNATFCTGNSGIIPCKEQFKDVRNRILWSEQNFACPSYYQPPNCSDVPISTVSVGFIACSGIATCGNGTKDVGECCDGGGTNGAGGSCLAGCVCSGSAVCGDGVCNGYETETNCSDCSGGNPGDTSTCPSNPITASIYGNSTNTVYVGDSASIGAAIVYSNSGNQSYNVSYSGCPLGAVCQAQPQADNVDFGEYKYPSISISNTGSLAPGTYPVSMTISSANDSACSFTIPFTLKVEPSRKTICDGNWYTIPPYPVGYALDSAVGADREGDLIRASAMTTVQSNTCNYPSVPSKILCSSSNWVNQTCTWNPPGRAEQYTCNGNNIHYVVPGWYSANSVSASTSVTDLAGRLYQFRRNSSYGSGGRAEYRCSEPPSHISGAKIDMNTGTNFTSPGATVGIFGPSGYRSSPVSGSNSNPFLFDNLLPGLYTASTSIPSGYSVFYDPNFNGTTFNWVSGNQVVLDLQPGEMINTRWGYQLVPAIVDIDANLSDGPINLPYSNNGVNLSWSYSNASSCSITPPGSIGGYPSGSGGPVSTGRLYPPSRLYSLSCNGSTDSVLVNVASPAEVDLDVIKSGRGTVTGSVFDGTDTTNIINCGVDCVENNMVQDSAVTLIATPDPSRVFTGWSGVVCSGGNNRLTTCSFVMDGSKTVLANFVVNPNFREF